MGQHLKAAERSRRGSGLAAQHAAHPSQTVQLAHAPSSNQNWLLLLLPAQTDDVRPLLDALLPAMSGASRLRRLELGLLSSTMCLLPGGQMVPAASLLSLEGEAQLAAHAAAGVLSVRGRASGDLLQPLNPIQESLGLPRLPAMRVVITSAAGEAAAGEAAAGPA